MIETAASFLSEHRFPFVLFGFIILFVFHFFRQNDWFQVALLLVMTVTGLLGIVSAEFQPTIGLSDLLLLCLGYGVALYIVLCELLIRGGARWLTKKRGEKWVKELDYLYLSFGLVGLFASINKIDRIDGRLTGLEFFGPLVVMTAVVIRFIKTRAEIAGWNKKPDDAPTPAGPQRS